MTWVNTSPLVKTYTLEEFWSLPEPPGQSKLELIAGVLFMTPPPDSAHDNIVTRINRHLTAHLIRVRSQGKIYVPRAAIWTSPDTYLEPDLFYISAELEARLNPGHRDSADLIIEVVSPCSAVYDRNTKSDTYAALGVRELWLVDETGETVEVRNLTGHSFGKAKVFKKGDKILSEVFTRLRLVTSDIFKD